MALIKNFLILILFPLSLSHTCLEGNFLPTLVNEENIFAVGPNSEGCFLYLLSKTKNKISLIFPKMISPSAEIVIYKSKSDISMKDNSYVNYVDRFLASENTFKEIDVKDFDQYIFIIIRDHNFSEEYSNKFILYDTQIPIPLHDGKPITMKYFFSTNIYNFVYMSKGNFTFIYSSKVKLKKYINATYNNQIKIEKKIDETDEILYLKSYDPTEKYFYFTVEDIEPGTEDQEFSVIVYEGGIFKFNEIERNKKYTINYINCNKLDEPQIFFFYYLLGDLKGSNTINFKLDPAAYKTDYIKIVSGSFHSDKELKDDDFEKYFHFDKNKFPIEYDLDSEIYKKIYFQDTDTSYPYRYIFFKVEIYKLNNYYSPQNFLVTVGEEMSVIEYINMIFFSNNVITKIIKPYFPTYFKIILNPKERYIFVSPYPKNTIYIEGDLVKRDENQNIIVNKDYYTDEDEVFAFTGLSEFTVAVFCSESFEANFYIERYNENDLIILENFRNNDPISITFRQDECAVNKKKYIVGIYNKEYYTKLNKTFVKYWTTKDGEMRAYYRNNITVEGKNLFPYAKKYSIEKEEYIYINNYVDFFTFTCIKAGTLTLRSTFKIFNETTHKIGQNTLNRIKIGSETEIVQLTSPIKPPVNYLHCAIFSCYGKKIKIYPDTPELFKETTIENDNVFTLKIDLSKFEPDQLAIKVKAEDKTEIEVVEIIKYNYTEYTVIKDNKMTHLTDNLFVRFLNNNSQRIKVTIKGLAGVPIAYGIVKLFTYDVDFLPYPTQFKDTIIRKTASEVENLEIQNNFYGVNDNKKYTAFIFAITNFKYYEFDAQVIEGDESNSGGNSLTIILFIIFGTVIIIIVVILYFFVKEKKKEKKYEMEVEKIDNEPLDDENKYKEIN